MHTSVTLRSTEILSVAGLAHGSLAQHKPWRCPLCGFINNFAQMIGFPAGQKYAAGRGWIGCGGAPILTPEVESQQAARALRCNP
jgi:hypothetical protein